MLRTMVWLTLVGGCAGGSEGGREGDVAVATLHARDYRSTYVELRSCRRSGDHELSYVRVLGTPESIAAYVERSEPFPADAVLVKEQYDFVDATCAGALQELTVMRREAEFDGGLGWRWQRTDAAQRVLGEDEPRCIGCHAECGRPTAGFEGTCATP